MVCDDPSFLEMALRLSLTHAVLCCHHRRLCATDMDRIKFAATIKSRVECSIDVENTSSRDFDGGTRRLPCRRTLQDFPIRGPGTPQPRLITRFLCSFLQSGANAGLSGCYDFIIDFRNTVICSAAVLEGLSNDVGGIVKHNRHNSAIAQTIEYEGGKKHDKIKSKRLTGRLGQSKPESKVRKIHEDLHTWDKAHKCDDLPRISRRWRWQNLISYFAIYASCHKTP